MPSSMKAMSSAKKRPKKATVDLSVQSSRIKVKMNQPWTERCQQESRAIRYGAKKVDLTIR